ncbi:DUF4116 domain-containing protein [Escherichia fergusonii]|uniref:DUF4116 domain-containing protein n=1 Tax=Escherichia fergusonii TaxID=564 RepID=UPI001ED25A74|nr:DUF4116 domain-containing protein [Escherichia fergusonii]EHJ4135863.1 DUF4116 domain-containing protein [Escherichia fergusonii]
MRNAIKNDSALLEFASERLRDKESIIQAAIQTNSYSLMYASDRIQTKIISMKVHLN